MMEQKSVILDEKKVTAQVEKPSMRDIGRRLGVSVASVSRALNNQPGVSEDLRRRVLEAAVESAYIASPYALHTHGKETHVIAFLLHHREGIFAQDPFYPTILHGLEQEAARTGYHVVMHSTSSNEELQIAQLSLFSEHLADACVIAGPDLDRQLISDLWRLRVPMVLVDNHVEDGVQVDSVETDNLTGAVMATRHLLMHHHYREVVMIHGKLEWASVRDRFIGYQQAMWEAGIAPRTIAMEATDMQAGMQGMQQMIAEGNIPRAVVTSNDVMALGAMRAARTAGLQVPKDIAIVGYDDISAAQLADPPLTTIHVHTERMGQEAARRLLLLLHARQEGIADSPGVRTLIHNELIVRESCGCRGEA